METQEISGEFLFKAWPWIEAHRRQLIGGVIGVAVLVGIISVASAAKAQKEVAAGIKLSQLLATPPVSPEDLLQLASAQSGTQAALRAQLQAATAYFENGKYTDAQAQYQGFADAHPTNPLAGEAFLGAGASLEAQGKADQAVSWYNKAAAGPAERPLPLADVRAGLGDGACRRSGLRANPSRRGGRAGQARRPAWRPRHRPRAHPEGRDVSGALRPPLPPRTGRCGSPLHPRRRRSARTGAPRLP